MLKGESYTTGTVHYAKTVANDRAPGGKSLIQVCGSTRRQAHYLAPCDDSAEVTCKRCEHVARSGEFEIATNSKADRDFYRNLFSN